VLYGAGPIGDALDLVRACERTDRTLLEALAPGRSDELLDLHARAVERARSAYLSAEFDALQLGSGGREVT
jgi:hypothetical protein